MDASYTHLVARARASTAAGRVVPSRKLRLLCRTTATIAVKGTDDSPTACFTYKNDNTSQKYYKSSYSNMANYTQEATLGLKGYSQQKAIAACT